MYRSSRSRGREKLHRAGRGVMAASDLKPFSADREGHAQLKKRTSASKSALDSSRRSGSSMEENSVALEFWRSSSKKVNGTPMRMLIDEEVSKDMETRHPSPSVIARLMGLDTLPPMMVHEQQKNMGSRFQTASSVGFQEKYASSEDHSHRSSTDEHQEFKDVFEVIEPSKVKSQKNKPVRKGMVSSEQNEADMDLIRQKFMEAKRLSTDEVLQNSNEFNDALEVLDSNKDLFLEFLQGPDSLFTMHLHDLKCAPPSSHASHITVLESSKGTKCQSSDVYFKSERNTGKFTHMRQEADSSFRKPATSLLSHSFKDYNDSLPKKLSKSRYVGKAEASVHPTRIVVLKPSLHKIQRMAEVAPTDENFQLGNRRRSEFPLSGIQESYMEGRYHQRLSDNVEILGHNVKSSREIAREITKHMKRTVSCSNREVFTSGLNMYNRSQSSCILSGKSKSNTSKTFHRICDHYDDWRNNFSPSSLYSAESSVSREARKHLSARWKKTHKFQEVGLVARGSSTLGEMLASSDREDTLDSLVIQKVPGKNLARDEILGTSGCPLGISSKDGWKDGNSRKLPRSKSLPASSTVYGSPKLSNRNRVGGNNNCYMLKDVLNKGPEDSSDGNFCRRRRSLIRSSKNHSNKPRLSDSHGDENMLPEQDIHVNSEELRNSIHGKHLDENKLVRPAHSDDAVSDRKYLIESSMLPDCRDVMQLSITQEEQVEQQIASTMLANNEGFSAHNQDDRVIEEQILGIQETSTEHPQVDSLISQYGAMESGSPVSSKECEQPSPISVLEPPSEEETSSSGCFERISAELQELRLQLQLLKLESADTYAEEPEVLILSDEDTGACCHSPLLKGSVLQAFRDDDDRDFSYLLDVLSESGVHGVNQDRIFDAFYSPNSPVGPGVFDKLEKKYCVLVLWSRSDRKLLFDLINIILVDLVAPCMDLHPWLVSKRCQPMWNHEGLAEGVWQMVVRQRKELAGNLEEVVLEQRWFSREEYADMIGREIEKILNEDLLEELVADFSLG